MHQQSIEEKLEHDISTFEHKSSGLSFEKVSLNLDLEKYLSQFFSDDRQTVYNAIDSFIYFAKFNTSELKSLPNEFFAKIKDILDNKEDTIITSYDLKKVTISLINSLLDAFPGFITIMQESNIFESIINTLPYYSISNIFKIIRKIDTSYFSSLVTPEMIEFVVELIKSASSKPGSYTHLNNIYSFIAYFLAEDCVPAEYAEIIISHAIQFAFNNYDAKANKAFYVIRSCKSDAYIDILVKNDIMSNVRTDFTILPLEQRHCLIQMISNIAQSKEFYQYLIDQDIFYYLYAWLQGSLSCRDNNYFQIVIQGALDIISNLINADPDANIPLFLESKLPMNFAEYWDHANFSKFNFYDIRSAFSFLETAYNFSSLQPLISDIDVAELFENIFNITNYQFITEFLSFCKTVIEHRSLTNNTTNLCSQIDEFFQDEYIISRLEELSTSSNQMIVDLSVYFLEKYQDVS